MAERQQTLHAPSVVERFVKALVVTYKAVLLYPPASNIPRATARDALAVLSEALQEEPDLSLTINKNGLFYNELPVSPENAPYVSFAQDLYNRQLAEVRFHSGADARDLTLFLSIMKNSPYEIAAAGGFESRLWDVGVSTITVREIHVEISDSASDGEPSLGQMPREDIDEALMEAYGGRASERLKILRFMGEPSAVSRYLEETAMQAAGVKQAGARLAEMAVVARSAVSDADRTALSRGLSQAIEQLEPVLRRELLLGEALSEARTNDAVAQVIRMFDVDNVCRMLVEDLEVDQQSREGLARAVRNLALISRVDRQNVMEAADTAMVEAGFASTDVAQVMEMASPSRLQISGPAADPFAGDRPVDTILHLIDLAPKADVVDTGASPHELAALQVEARRGITDGDVVMALTTLVSLDARPEQFASAMGILEESLDLLVRRGELDIAADTAETLRATANDPELTFEQQARIERALAQLARPEDMMTVAHALRVYEAGSVEHEAAKRLLSSLGATAVGPLIEQLADETDMAYRKSIVDLLAGMATDHLTEVASYVSDPRWYVVRNVLNIIGRTKSSAILPYIERTVRHPEPRVRRETIRALSGINDRFAHEMLISMLSDEDGQNVQLAARYLGQDRVLAAREALEQVARAEGRGNRDLASRVEAIEGLGSLGDERALSVLESISGKRSLFAPGKARELRAASLKAIAQIEAVREVGDD